MLGTLPGHATVLQDEIFGDGHDGFDLTVCDGSLASNSTAPGDFAAALDLCQITTESAHSPGLISATLTLADGSGTPAAVSHAIRTSFGTNNTPRAGSAMVVLSTGAAASPEQTEPSFVAFQLGADNGTQSNPPNDWFTANGGKFPVLQECPAAAGDNAAIDPVMLTLRIRVPSNARSFSLDANLFIADFPEYICSPYNDDFVALLDSSFAGNPANPADKNLANYNGALLNASLARLDIGLFTQCLVGNIGCSAGAVPSTISTCSSTAGLTGTGMDTADGACYSGSMVGGGTGWLVIRGNVVPGETIQLRLAIWDVSDYQYDSLILLDHLQWSYNNVTPGVALN
jgi:hypothetical protein